LISQMKLPIDLIILDLDGTLTDSIPPAIEAIQEMIGLLGLPYKSKEDINKHVGFGEIPLVSGAIGTDEPGLLKKAMDTYTYIYYSKGLKTIPLYPGVREFLEHFKDKPKIIISNKKDGFIREILKNHGLTKVFSEVHGGDTMPCLKPDPCLINDIIAKKKLSKDRVILVGDMTVDIETGKNAGIKTCAVTYGFDEKSKLEKLKPDLIVDDLRKLKDLIV
jgi:phosphoglycolate phosphatase